MLLAILVSFRCTCQPDDNTRREYQVQPATSLIHELPEMLIETTSLESLKVIFRGVDRGPQIMTGHNCRSAVTSILSVLLLAASASAAQDSPAGNTCESRDGGNAPTCNEETVDTSISQDTRSGSLDDSDGTIASAAKALGLNPAADLRGGYSYTDHENPDGSENSSE
jgi:hypothetical protein